MGTLVGASARASSVLLRTTDDESAISVLQAMPGVVSVRREDGRLIAERPQDQAAAISRALAERQIWPSELRPQENNLEDFFIEITGEEPADA